MPYTAKSILDECRILLNDRKARIYKDDAMLPILLIAYKELAEMYEESEMPMTNETSAVLSIGANIVLDIGGSTGPALPLDLVEVNALWERTTGTNEDFQLMTKVDNLPKWTVILNILQYWSWQVNVINFLGATTNRDVKLDYVGNTFSPIKDVSSLINVLNAETALTFRTVALAASSIGEDDERSQKYDGYASNAVERLLNISTKSRQVIVTRRRPFRAGYKQRSFG